MLTDVRLTPLAPHHEVVEPELVKPVLVVQPVMVGVEMPSVRQEGLTVASPQRRREVADLLRAAADDLRQLAREVEQGLHHQAHLPVVDLQQHRIRAEVDATPPDAVLAIHRLTPYGQHHTDTTHNTTPPHPCRY